MGFGYGFCVRNNALAGVRYAYRAAQRLKQQTILPALRST